MTDKEILYIGDPMCSWCWGFAPVITNIYEEFSKKIPISLTLGGLHAHDNFPMSEEYKANIKHHWEDVNKMTGATFDYRFFDREGFILNTEPACRAVVAVRHMRKSKEISFYEKISRSFYSENKDTTNIKTYKSLCIEEGLDFKEFSLIFHSDEIKRKTAEDFAYTKNIGVSGFPTLIAKDNEKLALISSGYQPYSILQPIIKNWMHNNS
tara:strand:+ start:465 stop:1094 length:630 start_codon:yes stop_codon:yes gene_type:complete